MTVLVWQKNQKAKQLVDISGLLFLDVTKENIYSGEDTRKR